MSCLVFKELRCRSQSDHLNITFMRKAVNTFLKKFLLLFL
ncbi:hypothetical protein CHCC15290_1533 [Bacillus licheniformis]|uniref:Uncharacterized protein n=1 Tax=Bacillus licheniformis TaxID=1402 RepID=A0A8B5YHJ1_BACLI|nr:hypothetical protein B4091_4741 [Bacillus licheniformis]KYC98008.1 hypothetical protein B4164_4429 [Bacillus licheniformis]OLG06161.1 hypothetical protein B4124_1545 [Bacillus licheniformis]TWJ42885.1 hypothetical protein CHCC5026_1004 [Bacillus licheniformis]TWJ50973.1 hypothetical protein CHCC5024_2747 [Bacillus licheniformis]